MLEASHGNGCPATSNSRGYVKRFNECNVDVAHVFGASNEAISGRATDLPSS